MNSLAATPAFKTETTAPDPTPAARGSLLAAAGVAPPLQASPARELQHELARRLQADEAPRWSRRRTLLFVLVSCGSFWAATAAVVARLLH